MRKKGFTLVELLGILVILSLVLLVALPTIANSLKQSKEREYTRFMRDLELATETYVETHRGEFPALKEIGGVIYVDIQELMDAGYIKETVIDPRTKEEIPTTTTIKVEVQNDKTLLYTYTGKNNGINSYVKNGLILWYDGLNHGNITNTWKDLSGNGNDGILMNFDNHDQSGWTNKGLQFDGVNDFVSTIYHLASDTPFTIEIVYEYQSLKNSYVWSITENGTKTGSTGLSIYDATYQNQLTLLNKGNTNDHVTLDILPTVGQKLSVSTIKESNDLLKLLENKTGKENSKTGSNIIEDANFILGTWGNTKGVSNFHGTIYSVRIYNRALTKEECKQNYEIDKTRFGL